MPTTPIASVRRQSLLLNGDEVLDPSLFNPDNADATIKGIRTNATGQEVWTVNVGGTGRGTAPVNGVPGPPPFANQQVLFYDAPSNTLMSSGVFVDDLKKLVHGLSTAGPSFTDRVDGVASTIATLYATPTSLGSVALALPAGCTWSWLRVEFAAVFAHNAGGNNPPVFAVWLGVATVEEVGWFKLLPMTTTLDLNVAATTMWTSIFEIAVPAAYAGTANLPVTLRVTTGGTNLFVEGGTIRVTGWYHRTPSASLADPADLLLPLPPNFTATNFQLKMPVDGAPGTYSNVEHVPYTRTYLSGGAPPSIPPVTLIDWLPNSSYTYARRVLDTLVYHNGGLRSVALDEAYRWLDNVYALETVMVNQVTSYQDPWIAGSLMRYPAGVGSIQAAYNLRQLDPANNGDYQRDFALQTIPYHG